MKYEIIKGSEKDFEGAPEWCTHVSKSSASGSLAWEVSDITKDGNKYQWVDSASGDYCVYSGAKDIILDIIAERRPITEPVWDGEGLPPVGVECEVMEERSRSAFCDWSRCKIVNFNHRNGAESQVCIIDDNGDFAILYENDGYHFRPIRSPEDVARDEAIEAMRDVVLASDQSLTCYESLYDAIAAGKIPGIKLEGK